MNEEEQRDTQNKILQLFEQGLLESADDMLRKNRLSVDKKALESMMEHHRQQARIKSDRGEIRIANKHDRRA